MRPYLALFSWFIFLGAGCQSSQYMFPLSQRAIEEHFAEKIHKPTSHYLQMASDTLHYMSVGESTKEFMLLMIHGSPGLWNNYLDYLKDDSLLSDFFVVSPDRMGYGASTQRGLSDVQQEARVLAAVLAAYPEKKVLVVGHSYGGPIAVQLQINHPQQIVGALLLAPTLDPRFEDVWLWRYFLKLPIIRHLMPHNLSTSNNELIHLQRDLKKLDQQYHRITQPVYYIHGTRDWLVNYENIFYVRKKMTHVPLTTVGLKGVNHFIPWTNYEEVTKGIRYLHDSFFE